jgi:predicted ATPase/DNA-binding SARP family transcriptional activator/ADP-ribose pyrophosphatase YjhB (NUDIX family)
MTVVSPRAAGLPLQVQLLGGFRVLVGGQPVPQAAWRQKGAAAIVKLLALEPTHRLQREQLMETLWPNLAPEAQANTFRQMLHRARRQLAAISADATPFLMRDGDALVLAPAEQVWVDVAAFEQALVAAWRADDPAVAEEALDRYHGDLLPDDRYAEWAETRRTSLRISYLTLLGRLAQLYEQRGAWEQAIGVAHRVVAADPTQEAAHAGLMRLYTLVGRPRQALRQYEQLVATLSQELDAEPEPSTQMLAATIRDGQVPALDRPLAHRPARRDPPAARRLRLPAIVGDLFGRERELAELTRLMSTHRLVTLTGPGGIGKTRLAVALGQTIDARFPHGAVFVDLAPVRDPDLVVSALARALGVREQGREPLVERVLTFVADKRLLVIFDNFEHLMAAAPLVTRLLEHAPQLSIVVTSRLRLRLRGEQEYPVGPLLVPPDRVDGRSLADVARYPAVALFIARAREVQPAVAFTDELASTLLAICQRLDGLPLAIELAASRTRVLTPVALLARLAQPLATLTGGPRDLPERQQTLRATIQWSYDLLPPPTRRLFRQLSVFAGGWTLMTAEAVMQAAGALDIVVLDGLQVLVEHCLITQQDSSDGQSRFGMLETIREFGLEQLALTGEAGAAYEQHARVFIALVERAIPQLSGDRGLTRVAELSVETANLRAAFRWLVDHEPARALQVFVGLERFWYIRKQRDEAVFWLDQALARNADLFNPDLALGHCHLAFLKAVLRDFDSALRHAETGHALFQGLEDRSGIGHALNVLGVIATHQGDPERAITFHQHALTHFRAIGDPHGIARQLSSLGMVATRDGDRERGLTWLRECLAIKRSLGDALYVCRLLNIIGRESYYLGRHEGAIADLEECLALARQLGVSPLAAETAVHLSRAMVFCGDVARAVDFLRESLEIARAVPDEQFAALGLESMAFLAALLGEPNLAGRLLGAGHVWREAAGYPLYAEQVNSGHYCRALCANALSLTAWDDAWQAGAVMTFAEAITYALAAVPLLQRKSASASAPLLTRRSGRVIIVDHAERVLLQSASNAVSDQAQQEVWVLPGGNAQDGEAIVAAAARALAYDTGLRVSAAQVRGPIAVCRGVGSVSGQSCWTEDAFFWHRLAEREADMVDLDSSAPEPLTGVRWWTLAELCATEAAIYPCGLATLVRRFLAGDLPTLADVVELPPSCLAEGTTSGTVHRRAASVPGLRGASSAGPGAGATAQTSDFPA